MPWDVQVMVDDRPGALAEVAASAAEAGINLGSVCAVYEGRGAAHLLVDEGLHAAQVLEAAGHEVIGTREVFLVQIENRPGALAEVTRRLHDADVGMRSMRILHRQAGEAMVAISMDRSDEAMRLIDDLLVNRSS